MKLVDGMGRERPESHTIFPICKQLTNKDFEIVGTGFFITTYGLFVTAKHVLMDVIDNGGNQTGPIGIFQIFEDDKGDKCILRSIKICASHHISDIAVGALKGVTLNISGEQLSNPTLNLTLQSPRSGEKSASFAYPDTKFIKKDGGQTPCLLGHWIFGVYEQFLPDASCESAKLQGPCHRIKMKLPGATSGGPVFGPDGRVYGIVSTNYHGTDISYVTRINEIMNIRVQKIKLDIFDKDEFLIKDIVSLGHINVD